MSYSVKKAGIPFYIKVDSGNDLTGYVNNLQAFYIKDATGEKTNISGSFVEDANTPGLYRLEVTIPSVGDYTIVVHDLSSGVNVVAPIVVTQATIDDVKEAVDALATTLSTIDSKIGTLDQTVQTDVQVDIDAAKAEIQNDIATIKSILDSNSALLNNAEYGLSALNTVLNNISNQLSSHDTDIKDILQAADGGLADIKSIMISRFDSVDSTLADLMKKVDNIQSSTSFTVFA